MGWNGLEEVKQKKPNCVDLTLEMSPGVWTEIQTMVLIQKLAINTKMN